MFQCKPNTTVILCFSRLLKRFSINTFTYYCSTFISSIYHMIVMQLSGEGSVSWEQLQELCIAMGVAEETAQDAWQRAGGGDGGTVDWEHILSHLAALSTHVCGVALSIM